MKELEMLVSADNKKWRKEKVFGIFNDNAMVKVPMSEDDSDELRYVGYPYYKNITGIVKQINKYNEEELKIILS